MVMLSQQQIRGGGWSHYTGGNRAEKCPGGRLARPFLNPGHFSHVITEVWSLSSVLVSTRQSRDDFA